MKPTLLVLGTRFEKQDCKCVAYKLQSLGSICNVDESLLLLSMADGDIQIPEFFTGSDEQSPLLFQSARKYSTISKCLSLCRGLGRIQGENIQPRKVRFMQWQSSAHHWAFVLASLSEASYSCHRNWA